MFERLFPNPNDHCRTKDLPIRRRIGQYTFASQYQQNPVPLKGALDFFALKRSYRIIIIGGRSDMMLVCLKRSYDFIRRRMVVRHKHLPDDIDT